MHIDNVTAEMQPWYESLEDVADGLSWAEERARLRAWVRDAAERALSPAARRSLQAVAFDGLTMRAAGRKLGLNASTVHRNCKRATARLRRLAEAEGLAYAPRWAS